MDASTLSILSSTIGNHEANRRYEVFAYDIVQKAQKDLPIRVVPDGQSSDVHDSASDHSCDAEYVL